MCTKLCTIANVHDTWTEWVVHRTKESYTKRTPKIVGHLLFKYISELCTLNVHRTNRAHILHRKFTGKVYKTYTKSAQVMHRLRLEVILYDRTAKMLHNMCTYYTYIMHILCTYYAHYVHITRIVIHNICILCAQRFVLHAQCVHIVCTFHAIIVIK